MTNSNNSTDIGRIGYRRTCLTRSSASPAYPGNRWGIATFAITSPLSLVLGWG
jgi:hypothetical protein